MKRILMVALPALLLMGCECQDMSVCTETGGDSELDRQIVQSVSNCEERNAVLAQHTLYPYHFEINCPTLNELGQRDLAILAEAYLVCPGPLNVRRGQTEDALYRGRVDTVVAALQAKGVEVAKVRVSDGLPGGDGISSPDAANAMRRRVDPVANQAPSIQMNVSGLEGKE